MIQLYDDFIDKMLHENILIPRFNQKRFGDVHTYLWICSSSVILAIFDNVCIYTYTSIYRCFNIMKCNQNSGNPSMSAYKAFTSLILSAKQTRRKSEGEWCLLTLLPIASLKDSSSVSSDIAFMFAFARCE